MLGRADVLSRLLGRQRHDAFEFALEFELGFRQIAGSLEVEPELRRRVGKNTRKTEGGVGGHGLLGAN